MRRLLPALAAVVLCLALASPAFASGRVPAGVKRISVTLTFPVQVGGTHRAVRKTLTHAATVRHVVAALDLLHAARPQGACPMLMRLGPVLTVVFRGAAGSRLAQTKVQVTLGNRGTSGSSFCFPITFAGGGLNQRLVGNGYVRLIGRVIGTALS